MKVLVLIFATYLGWQGAFAQETVFSLLKDNKRTGDEFYERGDYRNALKYYSLIKGKKGDDINLEYKLSRCFYFLKDYRNALIHYNKIKSKSPLLLEDAFYYSEMNTFVGNYAEAIHSYELILKHKPGDGIVQQKIWQLKNIQFLYEDSLHFTIRPLNINTEFSEMCPIPFEKGIVFLSDRKKFNFDEQDESFNTFFNLYYAESRPDTISTVSISQFKKPRTFNIELSPGRQLGAISFYNNGSQCVFAATGDDANDGATKMQLYFAAKREGKWKISESYRYNNNNFNFLSPSISPDGYTLYFSSDMPGGLGGSDIYRSQLIDGAWSAPENLGDMINTPMNELFPFIHLNTLYFSSNGHPGLGGLDIFSIIITDKVAGGVKNLGYPINSSADDFGIVFTSGSDGYLSSNRRNGGFDDDLFEFEMDFRIYPFLISGVVKIKENSVVEKNDIGSLAGAKIYLIDNIRQIEISETRSDLNGHFTLSIPWFSKYLLRIVTREGQEHLASLEISKNSSFTGQYEIVVVKDVLTSLREP